MLLLSQESCFWMEACAWQGIGHGADGSGQFTKSDCNLLSRLYLACQTRYDDVNKVLS